MSPATPETRELAARASDGVHVLLLWHPDENAVTVSVEDARVGDRFQIAIAPDRALDAFYHPLQAELENLALWLGLGAVEPR
jgi:hypothetical protein